jgi:hypothetical protein
VRPFLVEFEPDEKDVPNLIPMRGVARFWMLLDRLRGEMLSQERSPIEVCRREGPPRCTAISSVRRHQGAERVPFAA